MKSSRQFWTIAAAVAALTLAGCSSSQPSKEAEEKKTAPAAEPAKAPEPAPTDATKAPDVYKVRFNTSKGDIVIEVHKAWAPIGAQHFYDLVKAGYYDGNRFFRVVPNFVAQFGMAGDPALTRKWQTPIKDDSVLQTNRAGSVVFAATGMPNSRTTHVFINLRANQSLDSQGFAPFGVVVEGMSAVNNLYQGYGEAPDQGQITMQGNAYLNAQFPKLDFIKKAEVLPAS